MNDCRTTTRDWLAILHGCEDGYAASADDRADLERVAGSGAATYGEITARGVASLLTWIRPTSRDVLFDLGSGTGRVVFQAAIESAVDRAIGVELSAARHHAALRCRAELLASMPDDPHRLRTRTEFRHEDLRATDLSAATLIWMASTAFGPDLAYSAVRHIAHAAPQLRMLLLTTPVPSSLAALFVDLGTLRVETTWSPRTKVHLARPRRAPALPSHDFRP
ncbi:MAG: hypothetical protein AB7T19_16400 [Planctomycetota bacterium]